jgi:Leucine-rich repeat (LRR) protein
LYKLNCTSRNIGEVEASIKKYNRLRCLILDFNYLERVSSLGSLFDLRELHIEGNMIAKIEGLETCKNLTVLNLAANRIEKI